MSLTRTKKIGVKYSMNIEDYAIRLSQHRTSEGYTFDCLSIDGEVDVLQIDMNGFEGFPVFLTKTINQILCIVYLWDESEIIPEKRVEMLEMMLDTSITIPLSAYARVGDRYVIYGALSCSSSFDKIVEEIVTLNENSMDVITAMEDFLI
jgi:uncharacterized protein YjfI (DUF2170 family)